MSFDRYRSRQCLELAVMASVVLGVFKACDVATNYVGAAVFRSAPYVDTPKDTSKYASNADYPKVNK